MWGNEENTDILFVLNNYFFLRTPLVVSISILLQWLLCEHSKGCCVFRASAEELNHRHTLAGHPWVISDKFWCPAPACCGGPTLPGRGWSKRTQIIQTRKQNPAPGAQQGSRTMARPQPGLCILRGRAGGALGVIVLMP